MRTAAEKKKDADWRRKRMKRMSVQLPSSIKDDILLLDVLKILAEDWLEKERKK